jgi:modulator of FtsH protease HflK
VSSDWGRGYIPGGKALTLLRLPRLPPRWGKLLLLGIALLILFVTCYYQVEPSEVGVVQRFGRYVRSTEPGPHLKIPFLEKVTKVPVERQLKMEFGFRTVRSGIKSEFETEGYLGESLMLTGDLNVAVVEWIVQYKIRDPYRFLFKVRDTDRTFRDVAEAAMRTVVGDNSVDEVLTIGRERIALEVKELLQKLCNRYEMGIDVLQLVLQDVNPPDPVKPSFNEVNQAIQEKERAINDAWAEYNKVVPRAKGEAEQTIQESEGYAVERVNRARGETARFLAILEEYRKSPAVVRRRLYLETLSEVLPRLGRKVIMDDKQKGLLPLLPLGELGRIPPSREAQP